MEVKQKDRMDSVLGRYPRSIRSEKRRTDPPSTVRRGRTGTSTVRVGPCDEGETEGTPSESNLGAVTLEGDSKRKGLRGLRDPRGDRWNVQVNLV